MDPTPGITELVLAPVELHRRNIQRRLREARTPKDGVEFVDPSEIAIRLLGTVNDSPTALDRIDRLSMIPAVRSADERVAEAVSSPAVGSDPRALEQARTELENVTGYHPERIDAFRDAASGLETPMDADSEELLDAVVSIERALRQHTPKSVSDVELVRRATRRLLDADDAIWEATFPGIERVSLVGVSSIPAAHIDLLHAVLERTSVEVHVHFRRGTGSYLARRIPELLDVADPGTVVFES
ncbi:hypothetical protein ACERIT_06230 [Halopenitus sp. H-Gu1]|uniref:hypothetical protein n=1 Tax=Halopenitus sp. H-Gu1 TaxID=3242697 RepID=UPI00359DBF0B